MFRPCRLSGALETNPWRLKIKHLVWVNVRDLWRKDCLWIKSTVIMVCYNLYVVCGIFVALRKNKRQGNFSAILT